MVFIETVGFLVELEALHPAEPEGRSGGRSGALNTVIFGPSFTEYRQEKIKKYGRASSEPVI